MGSPLVSLSFFEGMNNALRRRNAYNECTNNKEITQADAHIQVIAIGTIVALVIAIVLILKKVSLTFGMTSGAKDIISAVLRILAAGVLARVQFESGIWIALIKKECE